MVCNLPLCIAQILKQGKWFEDEEGFSTSMWPTWLQKTVTTIQEPTVTTRDQTHVPTTITTTEIPTISVNLLPETGSRLRLDESYADSHSTKVPAPHFDSIGTDSEVSGSSTQVSRNQPVGDASNAV